MQSALPFVRVIQSTIVGKQVIASLYMLRGAQKWAVQNNDMTLLCVQYKNHVTGPVVRLVELYDNAV